MRQPLKPERPTLPHMRQDHRQGREGGKTHEVRRPRLGSRHAL